MRRPQGAPGWRLGPTGPPHHKAACFTCPGATGVQGPASETESCRATASGDTGHKRLCTQRLQHHGLHGATTPARGRPGAAGMEPGAGAAARVAHCSRHSRTPPTLLPCSGLLPARRFLTSRFGQLSHIWLDGCALIVISRQVTSSQDLLGGAGRRVSDPFAHLPTPSSAPEPPDPLAAPCIAPWLRWLHRQRPQGPLRAPQLGAAAPAPPPPHPSASPAARLPAAAASRHGGGSCSPCAPAARSSLSSSRRRSRAGWWQTPAWAPAASSTCSWAHETMMCCQTR